MTCRLTEDDGNTAPISMTVQLSSANSVGMENKRSRAPPAFLNKTSPDPQKSQSMPSTPAQRPFSRDDIRRSPSLTRKTNNTSPRSLRSDTSITPPISRKQIGGCKYETGMARARRRVPYSLGPDRLDGDPSATKKELTQEEDEKLTASIQKLYDSLVPSEQSEQNRAKFVQKLEKILRGRWPNANINVNVFGSTGNNLGTSESDVDICITTDSKELERVCSIADLLAKHGMERVVCVSSARVPIVKVWDPELQVACDLNVNNPIALENTALVRSYVSIDPRVRPLAMLIKYWAKRRILNDAALGGTLSSYTWICLALNFLQTRNPPILPSLQRQDHVKPHILKGVDVAFDKDLNSYEGFGSKNKSSLGELLFQFFRYYGHDFDFEEKVVSVRVGELLLKSEKSWHLLQDNRLCVEEPFNISRNLANTADDTSMRGIHQELRRAYTALSEGDLDKCCEQFTYPPDEVKTSDLFVPPTARPIVAQAPTQQNRGTRSASRGGGRHGNNSNRNLANRRSSNPAGRTPVYLRNLPFQMTTQELQLQAQHQQHLLHDQLFQQYQYLQLQEQELRMQLHQQNLLQRAYQQRQLATNSSQDEGLEGANASFLMHNRPPLTAPLYQQRFGSPSNYFSSMASTPGVSTNPPSPHLGSAIPDTRRYSRRTSVTQAGNGGAMRAHSQPARSIALPFGYPLIPNGADFTGQSEQMITSRSSISSGSQDQAGGYLHHNVGLPGSMYDASRRPAEYVGYYVGQSPTLLGYPQSASISPIPSHVGLAIQNGGLSPRLPSSSPQLNHTEPVTLPLAAPSNHDVSRGRLPASTTSDESSNRVNVQSPKQRTGPLVINGSINSPVRRRTQESSKQEAEESMTFSASTSEDLAFDTPSSSDEQSQDPLDCATMSGSSPSSPRIASHEAHLIRHSTKIQDDTQQHQARFGMDHGKHPHSQTNGHIVGPYASDQPKPTSTAWPLGRKLSAVEEVRTPTPGQERLSLDMTSAEILDLKGNLKHRSEKSKLGYDEAANSALEALTLRPNGIVPHKQASPENDGLAASNGWQTQRKKKKSKRMSRSENDIPATNPAGGDLAPFDESLRKGG